MFSCVMAQKTKNKVKPQGVKQSHLAGSFRVHGNKIVIVYRNKSIATGYDNTVAGWLAANKWWERHFKRNDLGKLEYVGLLKTEKMAKLIERYLVYKKEVQKVQPRTLESIKSIITNLLKDFDKEITKNNIIKRIEEYVKTTKHQYSTQRTQLCCLQSFLHYLLKQEIIDFQIDMSQYIKPTGTKQILIYTVEEYYQIINHPSVTVEDRLIYELLWNTGCRINEILTLRRSQIDFESHSIYISNKIYKGQNETVLMTEKVEQLIKEAMKLHPNSPKLFEVPYISIYQRLVRLLKKLDMRIARRSFHSFRKTYTGRLIDAGLSPLDTADILRHRNINTTMKFYKNYNKADLLEKLNKLKDK